jgi:HPt (histidine-containing phosphotransfer) domain-containing protein
MEILLVEGASVTNPGAFTLPTLDQTVLDRLRTELDDDEGLWRSFVQDFITNLPHRIERLRLALTTADMAGAVDAVLSLKTSSQMVGAERLAGMALDVELSLRQEAREGDSAVALPRLAAAHFLRIKTCAQQTEHHLEAYLR